MAVGLRDPTGSARRACDLLNTCCACPPTVRKAGPVNGGHPLPTGQLVEGLRRRATLAAGHHSREPPGATKWPH